MSTIKTAVLVDRIITSLYTCYILLLNVCISIDSFNSISIASRKFELVEGRSLGFGGLFEMDIFFDLASGARPAGGRFHSVACVPK